MTLEAPSSADHSPIRKSDVLVVESDSKEALELGFLLFDAGFEVTLYAEGPEALAHVASDRPRLVLSDVIVKGMDGFELCQQITDDPRFGAVPVVLLSGGWDPPRQSKAQRAGASALLPKSCARQELVGSVRSLLTAHEKAKALR